jgi:ABC-type enterochelin transport system permease subunit
MITPLRLLASSVVLGLLLVGAAWIYRLAWDEAIALAPVSVATVGATLFLVVLWTKVAYESLRRQRHPYLIVAGALLAIGLLVVVSFFVELPSAH